MARVILLKDVPKVGQRGDIKEVKDGFFRHFLLPQKLAEVATAQRLQIHDQALPARAADKKRAEETGSSEIARLDGKKFVFNAKATKKGALYKAVSAKDIAARLAEEGFGTIQADWIGIEKSLKEVGEKEIEIKNPSGKKAVIKIEIKALPKPQ